MNARRCATIFTSGAVAVAISVPAAGQDPMPPAAGDSSIILADRTFFPTPAMVLPDTPFSPAFQVEESEPGSFALGAFVGLMVAVGINSQIADQGDGAPALFLFPMCVIGGAMIFWSAGIG